MKFSSTVILAVALLLGGTGCAGTGPVATQDTTPPVISDIRLTDISQVHMDIAWTTNEPATSQVEYGTTPEYGSITPLKTDLVTTHGFTLDGLTGGTLHHYRVRSKDAAGNEAISEHKVQATYHHL